MNVTLSGGGTTPTAVPLFWGSLKTDDPVPLGAHRRTKPSKLSQLVNRDNLLEAYRKYT